MPSTAHPGQHHDLNIILQALRAQYFPDCGSVTISWGRWSGRARPRSMRFGVYFPETHHIRIHPALDQAFVPRFFVEFVVYHELLHHIIPPVWVNGRYYVHSKTFRQRERTFRRYPEAMAWRQRHLRRLLASNKGRAIQQ